MTDDLRTGVVWLVIDVKYRQNNLYHHDEKTTLEIPKSQANDWQLINRRIVTHNDCR